MRFLTAARPEPYPPRSQNTKQPLYQARQASLYLFRRLSLLSLLLVGLAVTAQSGIPRSTNQLVNDFGGHAQPPGEEAALTSKLNEYARETSTQIAVVTERSAQWQLGL